MIRCKILKGNFHPLGFDTSSAASYLASMCMAQCWHMSSSYDVTQFETLALYVIFDKNSALVQI